MNLKKLKRFKRRIKNLKRTIPLSHYLKYFENTELDDKAILLECSHGTGINGNIFYLLKELCSQSQYNSYKVYLSVNNTYKKNILTILNSHNIKGYTCVEMYSDDYYKTIASSKYLINDTTFLPFFIKREGQVYLNTWHGTPLKTLGIKVNNDYHNVGNVMRNFLNSDYLLYPNEYTKNHMIEDFMLENICKSKTVLGGYPRNSIFFNHESREKIRKIFNMEHQKVIAYMPTWRGTVDNKSVQEQIEVITDYLKELDSQLDEYTVVYVNFHLFLHSQIDVSLYKHIKYFPSHIETYEFLNACDMLITDYSSVFFDYALTHNKIVLFTYDKEQYFEDRGVYVSLDSLPFPQVNTIEELVKEIYSDKSYDDSSFMKEYCFYDNMNASKKLLDLLLFNQNDSLVIGDMPSNGRDNVLLFCGNLAKNGITTSLFNLLENIDTNKFNYFITFHSRRIRAHRHMIKKLPEGVHYIPMTGKMNASLKEKIILSKYYNRKISINEAYPVLERLYTYDIQRKFCGICFKHVIHFTGYECKTQLLFSFFKNANRVIFVHNNMVEEMRVRDNQHPDNIKYCYNTYDKVALVTKDMEEFTQQIAGQNKNFTIVNNIFDYKSVIEKSQLPLLFDDNTQCTIDLDELKSILNDQSKIKFINVGRFSPEKGHTRLIKTFDKVYEKHPEAYLIIIGGHGPLYNDSIELAQSLKCKDHVILIKSLSNPFPIVKKCQCFAFTSFHEGLGLVMLEADALGLPVFSTDIPGPRGFIKKYNGYLVENSDDGIYSGFEKYFNNELQSMNVDYQEYNHQAIEEFENLFN